MDRIFECCPSTPDDLQALPQTAAQAGARSARRAQMGGHSSRSAHAPPHDQIENPVVVVGIAGKDGAAVYPY